MALFGKKKEEIGAMPPMPPAPPQVGNGIAVPAAPTGNIPEPVRSIDSLSTPPVPGGSLVDIKAEVAQKPRTPGVPSQLPELPQVPGVPDLDSPAALDEDMSLDSVQSLKTELDEDKILSDDSLFDFSELETQMANRSDESSDVPVAGESGESDFVCY